MHHPHPTLRAGHARFLTAALVTALAGTSGAASAAPASSALDSPALERRVAALSEQLDELKAELHRMKARDAERAAQQQQQTERLATTSAQQKQLQTEVAAATQAVQQSVATAQPWDKLSIFGYGEAYYHRPTGHPEQATADLARAVFGFGYQFDDKTRFASEFEVEHAITSSSDAGEFEVEQFYVDHAFNDKISAQAGLFLIPSGLLNENHEPTAFYGVTRNFVETLIIPTTWREGGVALHGTTDAGLAWNLGLTTGLDLSKWNFKPDAPLFTSAAQLQNNGIGPMQATHQELALANAQHLSQYVALNYRGVPGLDAGASVFTGKVQRTQPDIGDNQRATLWETHVRYQPGKWDLSALYAHGNFSNTAQANAANPGTNNPIPAAFYGWYVQAAYNAWQHGGQRLSPFARYEKYDMGARYAGLPQNFSTPAGFPSVRDTVITVGANYYLNPSVVFKIDYQRFNINRDFSRVDLGMGLQF